MKYLLILSIFAVSAFANDPRASLRRPGTNHALNTTGLANPFIGMEVSPGRQDVDEKGNIVSEPEGMTALKQWLLAHPVSALAWTEETTHRSVMIAGATLRIGSKIPPELCEFGGLFSIQNITKNAVSFSAYGPAAHTPFTIVIPITIKQNAPPHGVAPRRVAKPSL